MEAKAKQTDIKMTARKLRRVINEVRGKSVIEAQDMLRFMPYFAARDANLENFDPPLPSDFFFSSGFRVGIVKIRTDCSEISEKSFSIFFFPGEGFSF